MADTKQRFFGVLLGVYFVVMLFVTVLSVTLKDRLMPVVEVVVAQSGSLASDSSEPVVYPHLVPEQAVLPGELPGIGYLRVVKERESFLGTEHYVQFVEVLIEESDGRQSAVTGLLLRDDRIVVRSNRPVRPDSVVRVTEHPGEQPEE